MIYEAKMLSFWKTLHWSKEETPLRNFLPIPMKNVIFKSYILYDPLKILFYSSVLYYILLFVDERARHFYRNRSHYFWCCILTAHCKCDVPCDQFVLAVGQMQSQNIFKVQSNNLLTLSLSFLLLLLSVSF